MKQFYKSPTVSVSLFQILDIVRTSGADGVLFDGFDLSKMEEWNDETNE